MSDIDLRLENTALRREFETLKLDSLQICPVCESNPEYENNQLKALLVWTLAYKELGSRTEMEAEEFDFPPVTPAIDPESDWVLFENWIGGKPTSFSLGDINEFFRFNNLDTVSDDEVDKELDSICELLATKNIYVEFVDGLPVKVEYLWLKEQLKDEEFQYLGENTNTHLTGCDCYCPTCMQRLWCDNGLAKFPEDEKAGKMIIPDTLQKYLNKDLPTIDQMIDY